MLASVLPSCTRKLDNLANPAQAVDKLLVVPVLSTALYLDRQKKSKAVRCWPGFSICLVLGVQKVDTPAYAWALSHSVSNLKISGTGGTDRY